MGDGDIIGKMLLGDSVRIIIFALENKFEYDFQEETEKCGLYAVYVQNIQDVRGDFGNRAVVDSKVRGLDSRLFNTPYRLREKEAIQEWGLFNKHTR